MKVNIQKPVFMVGQLFFFQGQSNWYVHDVGFIKSIRVESIIYGSSYKEIIGYNYEYDIWCISFRHRDHWTEFFDREIEIKTVTEKYLIEEDELWTIDYIHPFEERYEPERELLKIMADLGLQPYYDGYENHNSSINLIKDLDFDKE